MVVWWVFRLDGVCRFARVFHVLRENIAQKNMSEAKEAKKKSEDFKASDAEIKACPGIFLPANAARWIGMYTMFNSKVLVITKVRFLCLFVLTANHTPGVCRLRFQRPGNQGCAAAQEQDPRAPAVQYRPVGGLHHQRRRVRGRLDRQAHRSS